MYVTEHRSHMRGKLAVARLVIYQAWHATPDDPLAENSHCSLGVGQRVNGGPDRSVYIYIYKQYVMYYTFVYCMYKLDSEEACPGLGYE